MPYPFYQNQYPNYYPTSYQPVYQQGYQQQQAQPQMSQQSFATNQNQVQNGGFVPVRSEAEARAYPVAPGTSITFKNETAPYCYTKTMGFSQLDRPIFEKYRLVKEEDIQAAQNQPVNAANSQQTNNIEYALKTDLAALQAEIDALKQRIEELNVKKPVTKAKKEEEQ